LAIGSSLRSRRVELAWGAFAAANIAVIVALSRWETIPFHFVWVSLTLVYGFRRWRLRTTMGLLLVVIAVTGGALAWSIGRGHESPDELAGSEHRLLMAQREFVRDASHELRTPITVARGHAELIRGAGAGEQVTEDAGVVLDELGHLERLSERLLLLTTAGHPGFLSKQAVDVGSLVEGIARRWTVAARRSWHVRAEAAGTIEADPERLATAVDGLVENAISATEDGEAISIACRADGSTLVLEVTDGGTGIPSEERPRIFDRFARVEADRARRTGGTGLGLSITKAIVEAHGGSLEVESVEGVGSTFRVRLDGFRLAPQPSPVPAVRPMGPAPA
jgi:signal transduction histidine kinase